MPVKRLRRADNAIDFRRPSHPGHGREIQEILVLDVLHLHSLDPDAVPQLHFLRPARAARKFRDLRDSVRFKVNTAIFALSSI